MRRWLMSADSIKRCLPQAYKGTEGEKKKCYILLSFHGQDLVMINRSGGWASADADAGRSV